MDVFLRAEEWCLILAHMAIRKAVFSTLACCHACQQLLNIKNPACEPAGWKWNAYVSGSGLTGLRCARRSGWLDWSSLLECFAAVEFCRAETLYLRHQSDHHGGLIVCSWQPGLPA